LTSPRGHGQFASRSRTSGAALELKETLSMKYRVIEGADAVWVACQGRVARLPQRAVHDGALTQEAVGALTATGFLNPVRNTAFSATVFTTTSCNLGCGYCFQNVETARPGLTAPKRIPAAYMTDRTLDDVVEFIASRQAALGLAELKVLLFGGEPLLRKDSCVRVLSRLRPLGLVSAGMVTNAVLLEQGIASELASEGMREVQVTFDGDRDSHDSTRATRNGRGTYDTILANLQDCADVDFSWQFRINISHRNLHLVGSTIDDLATIPFRGKPKLRLALVDDVGLGYANELRYGPELATAFKALIARGVDAGFACPITASNADCTF
ncbi:hypothetical protein BJM39_10485, partial [Salmonella enterica subsp. enterica serovar Javiana]